MENPSVFDMSALQTILPNTQHDDLEHDPPQLTPEQLQERCFVVCRAYINYYDSYLCRITYGHLNHHLRELYDLFQNITMEKILQNISIIMRVSTTIFCLNQWDHSSQTRNMCCHFQDLINMIVIYTDMNSLILHI